MHGLGTARQMAVLNDRRQGSQHVGLEAEIHRAIGIFPIAEYAETFEIRALRVDLFGRVFSTLLPESAGINFHADLANLLFHRQLDR